METSLNKIKCLSFIEQLLHFKSIDSTNTFAKGLASLPASGITVICADTQRAGRGRHDNTFFSSVNGGLYSSLVCFVSDITNHFTYNRAVSLAVIDAIQNRFEASPLSIKWPNDIFWGDKKLCGILLESIPGKKNHIIIGFGINVNLREEDFPIEIRDIATSLLIETGEIIDIHELLFDILSLFWNYSVMPKAAAHSAYCGRLYKVGAPVEINDRRGLFTGVREDGCLCLKNDTKEEYIMSGTPRYI